jgi:tRNA 2-thiocytidine biosynthesis protein TtcA
VGKQHHRRIFSSIGKAIADYRMIQHGDRILLAVSGGKDSLLMAWALADIRKRSPAKFSLEAVTIDPGEPWQFSEAQLSAISRFLAGIEIPHHVISSNVARIVTKQHGKKTPCSLCANLRRGSLHQAANDLGFDKLALGHTLDDAIETLFLNMFFQGSLRCFKPKTYLSRRNIEVIRPMVYVEEPWIRRAADRLGLPVAPPSCSYSGNTNRQYMKDVVSELSVKIPGLKRKMQNVLQSVWRQVPVTD